MVLVLGIGITARASFEKGEQLNEKQIRMLENEYLEEVRQLLLEKGCKNAGVMLTYKIDAEGNKLYIVNVHHAKIRSMNEQEFVLLQARIQEKALAMLRGRVVLKLIQP